MGSPEEHFRRLAGKLRFRNGGRRGAIASGIRQGRHRVNPAFLQSGIETDIDGASGRGGGDQPGAQKRFDHRADGGRLVVPLDVGPDQRRLIPRRMDPVDPWPPFDGIHRAGRSQKQQRDPVAPGIEYRHGRMHQPDIAVNDGRHRTSGNFGPAMRDGHRMLLVQAEQHLRIGISIVVDEAVVQPAKARAGIQRDKGNFQAPQHFGRDIARPGAIAPGRQRSFDRRGRVVRCKCADRVRQKLPPTVLPGTSTDASSQLIPRRTIRIDDRRATGNRAAPSCSPSGYDQLPSVSDNLPAAMTAPPVAPAILHIGKDRTGNQLFFIRH